MALDKRHLKKHGNQYLVVLKVPARLREVVGKAHLKHPLHTDSLSLANRDKHKHLAAMKDRLAEAERELVRRSGKNPDGLAAEALDWRQTIAEAKDAASADHGHGRDDHTEDGHDLMLSLLADRSEEIEKREGTARAMAFNQIARGEATPISTMIEAWLAEKPMKPRQRTDYHRAITKFVDWLAEARRPSTVEACSRRVAGSYVTEQFASKKVNPRTANKDVSCLSSLWNWLEKKGYVAENIWTRQGLEEIQASKGEAKRPYTDAEIATLFNGKPSELLGDMMAIAALSGMRIDEIAKLSVADVQRGCFDIKIAKTPAGEREVPIHSGLASIIKRRTEGKSPTDPLFPELPTPKPGSPVERSQKVVKAFTNYRRKTGVDDVVEGARQSRIDFHSFRRWFITKAEQAGQPPHIISAVVGHKRAGITLSLYSGGPMEEQFRACVEAVKLPG